MFRKLVTPILAILLLLPTLGNTAANHVKLLNDTVRPFQWTSTDEMTGEVSLDTHCSIFSVNPKNHGWMTAAHCIVDEETGLPNADEFFIAGHKAVVVEVNVDVDLALVQTPDWSDPVGLKLATKAPVQGDMVEALGYGWALTKPLYFAGLISQTEVDALGFFGTLAGIPAIGGMSGCPIVDSTGRVVGVTHVRFGEVSVLGLTPYSVLKAYDRGWVFTR